MSNNVRKTLQSSPTGRYVTCLLKRPLPLHAFMYVCLSIYIHIYVDVMAGARAAGMSRFKLKAASARAAFQLQLLARQRGVHRPPHPRRCRWNSTTQVGRVPTLHVRAADFKKLEHGSRMMSAGVPSLVCGWRTVMFQLCGTRAPRVVHHARDF